MAESSRGGRDVIYPDSNLAAGVVHRLVGLEERGFGLDVSLMQTSDLAPLSPLGDESGEAWISGTVLSGADEACWCQ